MKTTRQTAANNPVLARIKAEFNTATFRTASRLMNEDWKICERGYLTREFVGMLFNAECRAAQVARIFGD